MREKTFNIAVCLSGQPRTWRTAKDNILYYFNTSGILVQGKEVQVDFFIHCWDINTYNNKCSGNDTNPSIKLSIDEMQEIQNAFNPIDMEYESYDTSTLDSVGPWAGMFYSFMKSIMLKKKYEIKEDFLYDIVVKSRLDLNFAQIGLNNKGYPSKKFYIHPVNNLSMYSTSMNCTRFPKEMNHPCFDDVFFYGDSPTMDIVSNLYRWYKEIMVYGWKTRFNGNFLNSSEFYYGPGTLLYKYMINWNIYPTAEIGISYYVVRKEAEDKKLHSINQWKEIYDIWVNWYGNKFGVV